MNTPQILLLIASGAIALFWFRSSRTTQVKNVGASPPVSVKIPAGTYKIIGLMDGRTLMLNGSKALRLDHIELPDRFGETAFDYLQKAVVGDKVEITPTRMEHGMQIGLATTTDGLDIIEALIRYGHARPAPTAAYPYNQMA